MISARAMGAGGRYPSPACKLAVRYAETVRSRRAWIYVLSVLALLVPAGGIAYLGAVSYRDEKGAVSAQQERQTRAAKAIAERIDRTITAALDAVDQATTAGSHAG